MGSLKKIVRLGFGLALMAAGASAWGDLLIPWEVRMGSTSRLGASGTRRYSALVSLPSSSKRYFGIEDDFSDLLLHGERPEYLESVEALWAHALSWYAQRMGESPQIYGTHASEIVEKLIKAPKIKTVGPKIILMDYHNPDELRALLREAGVNQNGLLPVEADYFSKGLEETRLERSEPGFGWSNIPRVEFANSRRREIRVDTLRKELVQWPEGGTIEFKSLSLGDPVSFALVYLIGRMHRFLAWSDEAVPATVTRWPQGGAFDSMVSGGFGMLPGRVKVAGFGDYLRDFYSKLSFKPERRFQNEHTFGLPLTILQSTVAEIDAAMGSMLFPESRSSKRGVWIYPDPELLNVIRTRFQCKHLIATP